MKLIIQIPCYNEERYLLDTLKDLPRKVEGFDKVEWLVIDDGSTDNTVKIAQENGVDYIIKHTQNKGLAEAFLTGLEACLKYGADVIVNTDADNQYNANDIPKLVKPILEGKADMVIGSRPIKNIKHFSFFKKILQKFGSGVVRVISGTKVEDAPSGFRAFSRETAMKLMVYNNYTYTLETIIQAGKNKIKVECVPIRVNETFRKSRLVKNIFSYVRKNIFAIIRIFIIYRPFIFFSFIAGAFSLTGLIFIIRFLFFYFNGKGSGHVQSLILAGVLVSIGFQTFLFAITADLLAANRKLLEDIRYQVKKDIYDKNKNTEKK